MADVTNIAKIPELRKRILFTLGMLAIYRLGVYIHTPWIDHHKVAEYIGGALGILNTFSGGALSEFSVFALGVMPYISSSIIFQLLQVAVPSVERLAKEGDAGRRKITQMTRYATIILSIVQGYGITYSLRSGGMVTTDISPAIFYTCTILTLTAGTCFLMWLGEMITERGIGNGISLIIFFGIVASIPAGFSSAWIDADQYGDFIGFLLLMVATLAVIGFIIFMERAQRRIPIQYAKRVVGRQLMGVQSSHLPLKVNSAGVIPPIFASSLLLFPATIAQFAKENQFLANLSDQLQSGTLYVAIFGGLCLFFTFFYTAITFNPVDIAENLKKHGGYIPGIRPGQATSNYLDEVLSRITLGGAVYIASICILPSLIGNLFHIPRTYTSTFSGTSLLILVGVAMDTLAQVESHLLSQHYQGFMGGKGGGRFRGRK